MNPTSSMRELSHRRRAACAILLAVTTSCPLISPPLAAQDEATNLRQAVARGKWALAFRPRFELVDEDDVQFNGRDAEAFTLRSSFEFASAELHGLTFGVEVEDVATIGNELFNNAGAGSKGNGVTDRPVVADPDLTEINQAWLAYDLGGKAKVKAGRFEQNLGDQRFVGAVAWRQNHQSFDALSVESDLGVESGRWSLIYLYVDQIHTVTGAREAIAGHLFDLRYETTPGTFGLSSQWLDYDASALWGRSLATTALSFTGSTSYASGIEWLYDLQWAQQDDFGNNPNEVSLDYYKADVAVGYGPWILRVGTESLEGDGTAAFQTPLATLHLFNGWADRFLSTPVDGLEDRYIAVSAQKRAWRAVVVFHDFSAERASRDYGTESDAQVLWQAPWQQSFGLKLANYETDGFATDVFKAMLFTGVSF